MEENGGREQDSEEKVGKRSEQAVDEEKRTLRPFESVEHPTEMEKWSAPFCEVDVGRIVGDGVVPVAYRSDVRDKADGVMNQKGSIEGSFGDSRTYEFVAGVEDEVAAHNFHHGVNVNSFRVGKEMKRCGRAHDDGVHAFGASHRPLEVFADSIPEEALHNAHDAPCRSKQHQLRFLRTFLKIDKVFSTLARSVVLSVRTKKMIRMRWRKA